MAAQNSPRISHQALHHSALKHIGMLFDNRSPRTKGLGDQLSGAALVLLISGAISAIFPRFTEESEAEGVWDRIASAAQQILFSYCPAFATANFDSNKDSVENSTRVLWVMIAENQQNGWQDLEFRRLKLC